MRVQARACCPPSIYWAAACAKTRGVAHRILIRSTVAEYAVALTGLLWFRHFADGHPFNLGLDLGAQSG